MTRLPPTERPFSPVIGSSPLEEARLRANTDDEAEIALGPEPYWRRAIRSLLWVVLTPMWLWVLLALWFYDPWPGWVRVASSLTWGLAIPAGLMLLPRIPVVIFVILGVVFVRIIWPFSIATNDRHWDPQHARLPVAEIRGRTVHIQNMRFARYGADQAVQWYSKRYDLDTLVSVDLVAQPLDLFRPVAHATLSFGFRNGDHVAVSVEARREAGETFSSIKGLFKQYELMYVIGDERDIIGRRPAISNDPVFVFPMLLTPAEIRALLESILTQAKNLMDEPRFYDPIRDNCTMNLLRHFETVTASDVRGDWCAIVPGFADALMTELGLIATDLSLDEARKNGYINHRTQYLDDGQKWSKQIRGQLTDDQDRAPG